MNKQNDIYSRGVDPSLFSLSEGEKWTDKYPHLGKDRVSYDSAVSPEFYDLEREAIFRRNWIYAGRAEWIAQPGQYFTKEIEICDASLIIVRGQDKQIRAFHNVCPHRGNKLVWDGHPAEETQGRAQRFVCKYHGLGFALDGKIEKLTDAESWFGDQGRCLSLKEVGCDVWNGFVFINIDPNGPKESLQEFLGDYYWNGFGNYPFDKLTERFTARGTCRSNWKTLMDAFNEVYHGVYVHKQAFPLLLQLEDDMLVSMKNELFALIGKHGFYISPRNPHMDHFVIDLERITQAAGTGPVYPMELDLWNMIPPAANPLGTDSWGVSSHFIFPNTQIQFYYPGWYLTYQYWPLAHNKMRFEIDVHHLPSRNFSEMLSHYGHISTFFDAALQDVNNLEATQRGLESGVFEEWPLTDEEIMVRGFHHQIYKHVNDYKAQQG